MGRASLRLAAALAVALAAGGVAACTSGEQTVATTTTAPTTTTVPETTTTTEPPLSAGRRATPYSPSEGDCFDVRALSTGASEPLRTNPAPRNEDQVVLVLDCDVPHRYEVAGTPEVSRLDGPYPGDQALTEQARRLCPPVFGAYVGLSYERSELEVGWLLPTPEQWDRGRRSIGCLVLDMAAGRVTGSVRDSGR